VNRYHEPDPFYRPTVGESLLGHPSMPEHPDDQWDRIADMESKGLVSNDTAQEAFDALRARERATAPPSLPRRIVRPILRIIQGGRG